MRTFTKSLYLPYDNERTFVSPFRHPSIYPILKTGIFIFTEIFQYTSVACRCKLCAFAMETLQTKECRFKQNIFLTKNKNTQRS
jgi:hypothetical protein